MRPRRTQYPSMEYLSGISERPCVHRRHRRSRLPHRLFPSGLPPPPHPRYECLWKQTADPAVYYFVSVIDVNEGNSSIYNMALMILLKMKV